MKIITDIDLSPNIQKYLPLIEERSIFYKQYDLKHPSALYNTSVVKIEDAVKDFLKSYSIFVSNGFENGKEDHVPQK